MWGVEGREKLRMTLSYLFFTFFFFCLCISRTRDEYRENRDFLRGDDVELRVKFVKSC